MPINHSDQLCASSLLKCWPLLLPVVKYEVARHKLIWLFHALTTTPHRPKRSSEMRSQRAVTLLFLGAQRTVERTPPWGNGNAPCDLPLSVRPLSPLMSCPWRVSSSQETLPRSPFRDFGGLGGWRKPQMPSILWQIIKTRSGHAEWILVGKNWLSNFFPCSSFDKVLNVDQINS